MTDYLLQKLTDADVEWCEKWLKSYTYVIACLTNESDFNEYSLGKLIKYEAMNEQREDLLIRMTARLAKLRRKREWHELLNYIRRHNEGKRVGKRHGTIPM